MTTHRSLSIALIALTLAGCGTSLPGTYRGDVRLMEGREETDKPGYSLAELREKYAQTGYSITLLPNGRATLTAADNTVEGNWRAEGNKVIILDDTSNGGRIVKGLRMEHEFAIGKDGELIHGTRYNQYNLEAFYTKE